MNTRPSSCLLLLALLSTPAWRIAAREPSAAPAIYAQVKPSIVTVQRVSDHGEDLAGWQTEWQVLCSEDPTLPENRAVLTMLQPAAPESPAWQHGLASPARASGQATNSTKPAPDTTLPTDP